MALGPERSNAAVYSRSRYGGYDFPKNRKCIERWLFVYRRLPTHEREHQESNLLILPRHYCSELEAEEVRVVQYR